MSNRTRHRRSLQIGLFGGTFDPVHNGHLAVARAARRHFGLDLVYFIPCGRPPHKERRELSAFLHRYSMVALAAMGERGFLPSLLEAGPDLSGRRRYYSVETVRRLRRALGPGTQLYFIIGADSFAYLSQWRNVRELLRLTNFVVVSRPAFDWQRAQHTFARRWGGRLEGGRHEHILFPHSTVHFLPRVRVSITSTEIRQRARRGQSLHGWVPRLVEDYIEKMGLYRR